MSCLNCCRGDCEIPAIADMLPEDWLNTTKERIEEIVKRVALFILFAVAAGGVIYGLTQLFEMAPNTFTAKAGGFALGSCSSLLIVGTGFYIYYQRSLPESDITKFDPRTDTIQRVVLILGILTAIGVIVGGVTTKAFTLQWQGVVAGFAFTAVIIKLVHDHRSRAEMRKVFEDQHMKLPTLYCWNERSMTEMAKKVFIFIAMSALIAGALVGAAYLFKANLSTLASQKTGLVIGGVVGLFAVGLFALLKFHAEHSDPAWPLLHNRIHRVYLTGAILMVAILAILHATGAFNIQDAFDTQWKGLLGGAIITVITGQLVAWQREGARMEKNIQWGDHHQIIGPSLDDGDSDGVPTFENS